MSGRPNDFSASAKREIRARARLNGNRCECYLLAGVVPGFTAEGCGVSLKGQPVYYEHINPEGNGGRNLIRNGAALVLSCWRRKTAEYDIPLVADTKRLRDRHNGIRRRVRHPMPCGKNSDWKRPVGGGPAVRRL
jgi:hypothetical protein